MLSAKFGRRAILRGSAYMHVGSSPTFRICFMHKSEDVSNLEESNCLFDLCMCN